MKKYEVERQRVKDSVAFWRRAEDNGATVYQGNTAASVSCMRSNRSCKYEAYEPCLAFSYAGEESTPNEALRGSPIRVKENRSL